VIDGAPEIILGIFVLFLALLMWRLTFSLWGWAVFFVSGSYMVVKGWLKILRK
jgi:hypothetical protein